MSQTNIFEEEKRKILRNENVLSNLEHLTSLQQKVLEHSKNFDLFSFFQGELGETSIGLITPKQYLLLDCSLVDTDNHSCNMQVLYDALYQGKITFVSEKEIFLWQREVMRDGNIALQLSSMGDIYLWLPEQINLFQYQQLKEFQNHISEVMSSNNNLFFDVWIVVRDFDEKEISVDSTLDSFLDSYDEEWGCFFVKSDVIHCK